MTTLNRQIVLASRPQGEATVANFRLQEVPVPELQEGQVCVRHHYLSLDPYMRGRMNESKSYAQPQPLGEVMIGGTVGEVVESRHPKFKAGDKVVGMGGWQEYSVVDGNAPGMLRKVDTTHVPLQDGDALVIATSGSTGSNHCGLAWQWASMIMGNACSLRLAVAPAKS